MLKLNAVLQYLRESEYFVYKPDIRFEVPYLFKSTQYEDHGEN